MKLKGTKVVVTGADGFIGSHLAQHLIQIGANVRAFIHYNPTNSWGQLEFADRHIKESIEIFQGDVRDPHLVRSAVRGCDVVFHLAALIGIPYSYISPQSYVDTNIGGTLNILMAVRELGVSKMIQTSTSETYGTAQYVPIDEKHPLQGQSPYAATKIGADQLAMSFFLSFETPVAIARPFNTFGPRQSARAIIPTIITQIASGKKEVCLGSLHTTRDFNYVLDIVAGFIKIAESEKSQGEVINLGTGIETSIEDLAKKIAKIMERDVKIIGEEQRIRPAKSEVLRLMADNTKAKRLLGWGPKYSIEEGLEETIEWFGNPENLGKYKVDVYNV